MRAHLTAKDIIVKTKHSTRKKKGKRKYLTNKQTRDLMKRLQNVFESKVEIPRINFGKKQTIETLISEEALLLAKFLREELKTWTSRITIP